MNEKVLLLNQDFTAIATCSLHKAFVLLYLQKAELVAQDLLNGLRTVSHTYPRPLVIRLQRYVRVPYKGIALTRQNIMRRDGYRCQYCGASRNLTLDHLLPRSRGGQSTWHNLITACSRCNSKKGDRTPEEVQMKLARKPFKPSLVSFLRESIQDVDHAWMPYLGERVRA
ncbi:MULTISPECIES: HNH endonuclease [Rufibacter]|uniref:5-methylcytosine-specific restriction endonuclease McrA n=1 Tax=Rufibacter quisquiliarum TaxID=1549639 RepID=A0A839GML9_9BACT|nr:MULTISPECIES: HNH endonuclease [Rufibacter]MBA9078069.1 5-methylcytosine-specific restriction endonuclease McrA [Rufibacter quisquiliarum]